MTRHKGQPCSIELSVVSDGKMWLAGVLIPLAMPQSTPMRYWPVYLPRYKKAYVVPLELKLSKSNYPTCRFCTHRLRLLCNAAAETNPEFSHSEAEEEAAAVSALSSDVSLRRSSCSVLPEPQTCRKLTTETDP